MKIIIIIIIIIAIIIITITTTTTTIIIIIIIIIAIIIIIIIILNYNDNNRLVSNEQEISFQRQTTCSQDGRWSKSSQLTPAKVKNFHEVENETESCLDFTSNWNLFVYSIGLLLW